MVNAGQTVLLSTFSYLWILHPSLLTYTSSCVCAGNASSYLVLKQEIWESVENLTHITLTCICYIIPSLAATSSWTFKCILFPRLTVVLWFWSSILAGLFHSFLTRSIFQTNFKTGQRRKTSKCKSNHAILLSHPCSMACVSKMHLRPLHTAWKAQPALCPGIGLLSKPCSPAALCSFSSLNCGPAPMTAPLPGKSATYFWSHTLVSLRMLFGGKKCN